MALGVIKNINHTVPDCELTLSSYFGTVDKNETITFTVITSSDNPIYAISSDTNIAVTTVNNKTVSVTGIHIGNVIITVMQENVSSNQKFLCIIHPPIGTTLDTTGWDDIITASQTGIGDSYWDVGDTKSITLNGTIGTLVLSNFATNVFILHFNYSMNGIADNNIIWGGFKDSSGKNIALVDSAYDYNRQNGTMYFNMNHWGNTTIYGSNYGGWKGSDFRYDILGATSTQPSDYGTIHTTACIGYDATSATLTNPKANTLLATLPSNFRNSLRLWSRWIDAVGNQSKVDANIKETVDAVTLLAEFEVFGTIYYANPYEQNHQSQMEYYRLGNSTIKYKHNDSSSSVWWWVASPYRHDYVCFSYVDTSNGGHHWHNANWSSAIAPAFKT